jgi:Type I restriction enzyme R protein N terminus (HSDR_N)
VTTTRSRLTEDQLVEQPAIELFKELGWEHINAFQETLGPGGTLGRDNKSEVFLIERLRFALELLNPDIPAEAIDQGVVEITRSRGALQYARANREIHTLLRDRVEVQVRQPDGTSLPERLTVVDWENPDDNDFLLVSQLWVHSDLYHRRIDLLGFVNGIPLAFIELKASHRSLKHAYDDNVVHCWEAISRLLISTPAAVEEAPSGLSRAQITTTVMALSPATKRISAGSLVTTVTRSATADPMTAPMCASATETPTPGGCPRFRIAAAALACWVSSGTSAIRSRFGNAQEGAERSHPPSTRTVVGITTAIATACRFRPAMTWTWLMTWRCLG